MSLRSIGTWAAMAFLFVGCGGQESLDATEGGGAASISSNQTGNDGGYYYSFWTNGQGSANMTLDGSNGYSVSWSNVGDFTCGKGWSTGSNHSVTFSGSYNNGGGGAFGLYGWTTNPLVEYYVVEASGASGSPASGTNMGTYTSDGATYTIYKHQQVNQPCITGNSCTFWQYISIRQGSRTSGTITTQNHFNAWASKGMNLGSHNYQILLTEGWNGSGNASAKVSAGGSSGSSSGGTSSSSSSSSGGGSSGGTGSCSVSVSAGSQWSDRYNLNITTNGASTWTVTANMAGASRVGATWNVSASYPSATQLVAKSNGSGNNWGMTVLTNGTWTWPTFSCRVGN